MVKITRFVKHMVSSINQMRDTPLLRKGVNKVALRLFEHNEKHIMRQSG